MPEALRQLAYYVRVCVRHDLIRERRPRRAWNHFWASRWYWSGGLLADPPLHLRTTPTHQHEETS
jgi:hypothetical protein